MIGLAVIAGYIFAGVCLLPWLARWELAGLRAEPDTYYLGLDACVRNVSEARLIRYAGKRAMLWSLGWPVALIGWLAVAGLLRDHRQSIAAKDAEEAIAENRRTIRAYDHAQRVAFDKALNEAPSPRKRWTTK